MAGKGGKKKLALYQTTAASEALHELEKAEARAKQEHEGGVRAVSMTAAEFEKVHRFVAAAADQELVSPSGPNARRGQRLWRHELDDMLWSAVRAARRREDPGTPTITFGRGTFELGSIPNAFWQTRQKAKEDATKHRERFGRSETETVYATVARVFQEEAPHRPMTENGVRDACRRARLSARADGFDPDNMPVVKFSVVPRRSP